MRRAFPTNIAIQTPHVRASSARRRAAGRSWWTRTLTGPASRRRRELVDATAGVDAAETAATATGPFVF